jgi:hypothetical protein
MIGFDMIGSDLTWCDLDNFFFRDNYESFVVFLFAFKKELNSRQCSLIHNELVSTFLCYALHCRSFCFRLSASLS